jgi:periplasmic divalent cation tolerance protein
MSFISIYITHPSKEKAIEISDFLIQKKLIACANIYPINSVYRWQGVVQREDEWVSLVKTKEHLFDEIVKTVELLHPYEIPCIMKTEHSANKDYEDWINNQLINS